MFTVKKCLCYFKLETGGLFIGWMTLIGYILGFIFGIVCFVYLCVYDCNNLTQRIFGWPGEEIDRCYAYNRASSIFILPIALCTLCAVIVFIGWECIQGTKTRDHYRVEPMMILLGILTVLSTTQMFMLTLATFINGIMNIIINGYCFVVIYSLYTLFRQEYKRDGINRISPGTV